MLAVANERGWTEERVAWSYSPRQLVRIYAGMQKEKFGFLLGIEAAIKRVFHGEPLAQGGATKKKAPAVKPARKAEGSKLPQWYRDSGRPTPRSGDNVVSVDAPINAIRAARVPVVRTPLVGQLPTIDEIYEKGLRVDRTKQYGPAQLAAAEREKAEAEGMESIRRPLTGSELTGGTATREERRDAARDYAARRPGLFDRRK